MVKLSNIAASLSPKTSSSFELLVCFFITNYLPKPSSMTAFSILDAFWLSLVGVPESLSCFVSLFGLPI
ncbi:MAG: hypothetical protein CMQ39_05045 [Gammaproteobacteria bacterium]|nr:hypothetical protein [Gammaproteobacteria bacterium]